MSERTSTPAETSHVQAPKRLAYLDGLRALAAVHVVLHHAFVTIFPLDLGFHRPSGIAGTLTAWLTSGHLSVTVFIVLSGYSLTLSARQRGLRLGTQGFGGFVLRRTQRIYPAYLASVVISTILVITVLGHAEGTHWDVSLPVHAKDVLAHVFLVHDVLPPSTVSSSSINHALWSVAIEYHLYLVFPLLLLSVRVAPPLVVAGVVCFGSFAVTTTLGDSTRVALLEQGQMLGAFTLGIAAAASQDDFGQALEWVWARAWIAIITLSWAAWYVAPLRDLTGAVAFSALLIALARGQLHWLRRVLEVRPLLVLGTMSYSLYLIHAPVVELVWRGIVRPAGAGLGSTSAIIPMLVLSLAASVCAARFLFVLVERPTLPKSMRQAELEEMSPPLNN